MVFCDVRLLYQIATTIFQKMINGSDQIYIDVGKISKNVRVVVIAFENNVLLNQLNFHPVLHGVKVTGQCIQQVDVFSGFQVLEVAH